jgi:hypothetical protein
VWLNRPAAAHASRVAPSSAADRGEGGDGLALEEVEDDLVTANSNGIWVPSRREPAAGARRAGTASPVLLCDRDAKFCRAFGDIFRLETPRWCCTRPDPKCRQGRGALGRRGPRVSGLGADRWTSTSEQGCASTSSRTTRIGPVGRSGWHCRINPPVWTPSTKHIQCSAPRRSARAGSCIRTGLQHERISAPHRRRRGARCE